jgi:hypothetical protein
MIRNRQTTLTRRTAWTFLTLGLLALLLIFAAAPASGASFSSTPGSLHTEAQGANRPGNDDFANAWRIKKWTGHIQSHNYDATTEPGELPHSKWLPETNHSVWYYWTAPWNGIVELRNADEDSWSSMAAIYTGEDLEELWPVSDDYYEVRWRAVKGTKYWIAIDSFDDDTGYFSWRMLRELNFVDFSEAPGYYTKSRRAKFVFKGDEGATFECRLDRQWVWRKCGRRKVYRRLKPGNHVLRVRQRYGTSVQPGWAASRYYWLIRKRR